MAYIKTETEIMRASLVFGLLGGLGFASASSAAITVTASPVVNKDLSIFQSFTPNTFTPAGSFTEDVDGVTWDFSGTGEIFHGTFLNIAAQPAGTDTNYMAVLQGKEETITFSKPLDDFNMVLGSADATGVINVDGSMFTGTGLASVGVIANGDQHSPFSNIELSFSGGMIDSVILTSPGQNSLEFIPVAAPELSTWAMCGLGFASLGWAAYRRGKHAPARIASV
jgi:hypothetical protein